MENASTLKTVLHWVAVFPGAALAAWLAWFLVALLNRLTMSFQGLDPTSFLGRAFIETMSHLAMGAAFVYVGAKIAPAHRKNVAFVLAGIALLLAGIALFPAIIKPDYWAIWGGLCLGFGAGAVVYSVSEGEINPNE